ncbi:MAG TPA: hypothetical protein VIR78_09585 [Malonomonas sp.]
MKAKKTSDFVISFRVNRDERKELLELAKSSGVSISQLLRSRLELQNNRLLEN